jgi:hypothetical protein
MGGKHTFLVAPSGTADANLALSTALEITNDGNVTMPSQPAFNVKGSSNVSNVSGTSNIPFNSEYFDQGSNFNTSNYQFTAPVTGRYQLNCTLIVQNVTTVAQNGGVGLIFSTSNRTIHNQPIIAPNAFNSDIGEWALHGSVFVDMDAGDNAYMMVYVAYGNTMDLYMAGGPRSTFSGFLVC